MTRERVEEIKARLVALAPDSFDSPAERHEKNTELSGILIELIENWLEYPLEETFDKGHS